MTNVTVVVLVRAQLGKERSFTMGSSAATKQGISVDLLTITGLAGVASYVIAYALLQLKLLDGNGLMYSALNVLAAALVLVSLTRDFNLASAVTQVLWIGIGGAGIIARLYSRRTVQPEHDDAARQRPTQRETLAEANAASTTIEAPGPRRIGLRPDLPPSLDRHTTGLRADMAPAGAAQQYAVCSDKVYWARAS